MSVYVQITQPNTHLAKFEGMSQQAVTDMLTARSKTYVVKTQNDWEAQNPPGYAIYVIAGQSNADYIGQLQSANLLTQMGDAHSSVIACGVGSTAMSRWMVGGDLYITMLSLMATARAAHANSYFAGLIFWQGESDNDGGTNMNAWAARFTAMVAGWRAAALDPKRGVVFAQITNTGGANRDAFRAMQAGISIPNCTMVSTDGIQFGGDPFSDTITPGGDHTNAAGYATMMLRFTNALKAIH